MATDVRDSDDEVYFSSSDGGPGLGDDEGGHMFDKDSDEEELERAVLGNKAGFRANLFRDRDLDDEGIFDGLNLNDQALTAPAGLEHIEDSALFVLDTAGDSQTDKSLFHKTPASATLTSTGDAPAWIDSDDERLTVSLAGVKQLRKLRETEADDLVNGVEYTRRLRQQYLRLNPMPPWAKVSKYPTHTRRRRRSSAAATESSASSDEGDEDEGDASDAEGLPLEKLLRDVNMLNGEGPRKKRKLRPEVIDIQRTRGIPDSHKSAVSSLSFHPQHPVLLSASKSSILYLHHISPTAHPTPNPQLTSVQVKNVPIRHTEFISPAGESIVFSGRRRFYHSWNISTGAVQKVTNIQGHQLEQRTMERFRVSPDGSHMAVIGSSRKGGGMLNIVRVDSMQWIGQARVDSRSGIADFCWWRDGAGITILGKDGQVVEWSLASKRTVGIWRDEGSIGGTVMALGGRGGPASIGGDRWVAIGSTSGILNIYDRAQLLTSSKEGKSSEVNPLPEPTRRCEQLTTAITLVAFTPDGQLLAFGSQHKKDALRLVHFPSCTVYRNWPTAQTPLGRITAVAFNSESDMLAVGNDMGKMRLWEIRA